MISSDEPQSKPNWLTLAAFICMMLFLIWINVRIVAPYLLALIMGSVLSLLFWRQYRVLRRRGFGPKVASLLLTTSIALLIIIPAVLILFVVVSQGIEIAQQLTGSSTFSMTELRKDISGWEPFRVILGNTRAVREQLAELIKQVASLAPGVVFKFFGGVPAFCLQLGLCLLSCYFFFVDGRRLVNWIQGRVPFNQTVQHAVFDSFQETAISSVLAGLCAALVQAAIIVVSFLSLSIPAAWVAGATTFVFSWIPLIGSTPVWLGGAIYLFFNGSILKGLVMLGLGIVIGLSDNAVRAVVLKGKGELHPLISLVAILGGIQLFGILGVFVGPIFAALFISVLNIWPKMAERFGLLKANDIVVKSEMHSIEHDVL